MPSKLPNKGFQQNYESVNEDCLKVCSRTRFENNHSDIWCDFFMFRVQMSWIGYVIFAVGGFAVGGFALKITPTYSMAEVIRLSVYRCLSSVGRLMVENSVR